MADVELIEAAIEAMRGDADPRWHAVADLLEGAPLGYARLLSINPNPTRHAANYPDAARGASLARAYLDQRVHEERAKYEISPGRVSVNDVVMVVDHPNVKVFEVDLESKYPGEITYTVSDKAVTVLVLDDHRTLRTDDSKDGPTEIRFPFDNAWDWSVLAEGARYTVRVCLYRREATDGR